MMTEKNLEAYKEFAMDYEPIELHFGDEIAYFPQTTQLNFIASNCLKDDVRFAVVNSKEYGDELRIRFGDQPTQEQVDSYIEEIIKDKGARVIYDCLFYSNPIPQYILEYCNFLIDPCEAEKYKYDIGE